MRLFIVSVGEREVLDIAIGEGDDEEPTLPSPAQEPLPQSSTSSTSTLTIAGTSGMKDT